MTYEQDNCRANTPTDKDKDSCQYAYEYDPVTGITLPPEQPRRWYRTTTYTDNDRANMHMIHQPTDRADTHTIYNRLNDRADTPAIQQLIDRLSSECLTYYYYLMLVPYCH